MKSKIKYNIRSYRKLFFLFLLLPALGFSQTLASKLDKKTLALGETANFTVSIFDLNGRRVSAAPKNELLPFHFEETKDSISENDQTYNRVIEFAVFEEGKFTIPALEFNIGGEIQKTIPYEVEVINTANRGDEIKDIMGNRDVKLQLADYWELYKWYLLAALILLAVIFLIIVFLRYGRKRKSSPVVLTNKTLKELDALKKKRYIEEGNFRSFYVELIDIVRNFITLQYQIPADVLLTDDLIEVMKKTNSISPENEQIIEDIFLRGDLVKFAKTFPDQPVMEKDFNDIRAFVKRASKDLEVEQLRSGV